MRGDQARRQPRVHPRCVLSGRAIGAPVTDTADVILEQLEVTGMYTLATAPANKGRAGSARERHTAFTGRMLALVRKGISGAGPFLTLEGIYRGLLAQMRSEGLPIPQRCGTLRDGVDPCTNTPSCPAPFYRG